VRPLTIKSKHDRYPLDGAILRASPRKLRKLKGKDFRHARKGVPHLEVYTSGKTRYLPLPGIHGPVRDYLGPAGQGLDEGGALPGGSKARSPGWRLSIGAALFGAAWNSDRRACQPRRSDDASRETGSQKSPAVRRGLAQLYAY
jgi:hypothetical protein